MSLDISVNSTDYLPQFYSNIFHQSFDSFKISYILLLGVVVMVYILIFALFGNSSGSSGPFMIIVEIILWVVLILVIGVNIQNYDYDFSTQIKNLFNSETTQLDVNVSKKEDTKCETTKNGEVFHIPNNIHSYEKARSICRKYNARLATYSEVEDAYNNGANWCS